MKRLLVYIEENHYQILRVLAFKHAVTLSCIIRWCINEYPESQFYTKKGYPIDPFTDPELEEFLKSRALNTVDTEKRLEDKTKG